MSTFTRRQLLKGVCGAAGTAAVGILAACGASSPNTASVAPTAGSTTGNTGSTAPTVVGRSTSVASSGKTVKLINVEHDSRPSDNAAYQAVYKSFKEKNPDIDIEFQIIPWEQARAKMLTLSQGDSLPNMGRMNYASDYAAANMVVPLEDMVDKAMLTRFDQTILDSASAIGSDGKTHLYGLPWFAGSAAILVNKTLLDKAGLQLKDSWTTDDFTEYAKALTQQGKQWGVAMDVSGVGDPVDNLLLAAYAYGGKWVKGDPKSTQPEPFIFNSPETIAGITWYTNLFKQGYVVPSAPSDTYKERDANFQSGKAAIEWQGPWTIADIQSNFKQSGYELASMPLPKGPAGNVDWYGGAACGIYVSSQKQKVVDQALKWVNYISSDEGEKLYCQANGMIPASKAAQQDPYWAQNPLYKGYLNSMANAPVMKPNWATGINGILDDTVPPLLQGVLTGKLTEKEMAQKIQDTVISGLQKNGVNVPKS